MRSAAPKARDGQSSGVSGELLARLDVGVAGRALHQRAEALGDRPRAPRRSSVAQVQSNSTTRLPSPASLSADERAGGRACLGELQVRSCDRISHALNRRGRDMSSQNSPCRYPPAGCAAIRSRKGRRFESELRLYHRRLTPHRLRRLQPVLHASGRRRDARPLLSINVKREGGRRRVAGDDRSPGHCQRNIHTLRVRCPRPIPATLTTIAGRNQRRSEDRSTPHK
jgi:hypothetical protein